MSENRPGARVVGDRVPPVQKRDFSFRFASALFGLGAVLLIVGNAVHPVDADPSATSRLDLAGATNWIWIHLVIALGFVAITAGFVTVRRSFRSEPGESFARLAATTAVMGGSALMIVFAALDGYGFSALARDWPTSSGAELEAIRSAALALDAADTGIAAIGSTALLGLTMGAFGLAVITGRVLQPWLGWVALVMALAGSVAGVAILLEGPTSTTINVLFRPVALLATLYFLVLAVALWRLGRRASQQLA